jgi:hypothetical protein
LEKEHTDSVKRETLNQHALCLMQTLDSAFWFLDLRVEQLCLLSSAFIAIDIGVSTIPFFAVDTIPWIGLIDFFPIL